MAAFQVITEVSDAGALLKTLRKEWERYGMPRVKEKTVETVWNHVIERGEEIEVL